MTQKKIVLSVDVERDISRYIEEGYIGVKEGIPPLLDLLSDLDIQGNFFLTGNVCDKHPVIMREISSRGHSIGCHGSEHRVQYYSSKSREWQEEDISKAGKQIQSVLGATPKAFRAPNFSVNSDTLQVLESLGYELDSSVLPGRRVKKWKLFAILDFRNAPREPYRPSREEITTPGNSNIVEVPVTENPLYPGIPIGSGFLNYFGEREFLKAVGSVKQYYVVLLLHPWELVDLEEHYPELPEWVIKACKSNFRNLRTCLEELSSTNQFVLLEDIQADFLAKDS
ncbi:MAG: polysaccharide deacetylase family protein [Thermoplasmata archaeon]